MEYERIHKVQTGIISPSKLRMKLIGLHHQRKKDGSNSNSSRTSPSKVDDSELVKNSLLALNDGDFDEEVSCKDSSLMMLPSEARSSSGQVDHSSNQPKETVGRENGDAGHVKIQQLLRGEGNSSSTVHPLRTLEEDNLDYDSNASSSSFEFHKGERSLHNSMARHYSRPMPSKWNDAEKWIMTKQNPQQANNAKRTSLQGQINRLHVSNMVRVVPDSAGGHEQKSSILKGPETKRVDFCQPALQIATDKFSFAPSGSHPIGGLASTVDASIDICPQSRDLAEVAHQEMSCTRSPIEGTTGFYKICLLKLKLIFTQNRNKIILCHTHWHHNNSAAHDAGLPAIRAVSMRDMGTEMTPATSLEPSRTSTPVGSTTPLRSPTSSIPSTPRRGAPAPTPTTDEDTRCSKERSKKELTEQELKLKTRREIVALGVQLGKMNVAAWASKDEKEMKASSVKQIDADELERAEFEKRAAAWEEAEKAKHTARYEREEIKIQAWESQQRAKLEAEMRGIEAQVEQMRASAQAKMVKKIALARQRSDEKRAAAETRKNRQAERTAAQAEQICQTGRIPSSHFVCCGWL
ncbi:Remorin, C-terminal [Dillenia turbinata]|uniref:Remorin, C-terminal n=1 Tax=Dillenia turbinata TaxID=194707 RepID=A0AAN8VLL8_9MAGN